MHLELWGGQFAEAAPYLELFLDGNLKGSFDYRTGAYSESSDLRLKEDIQPLHGILAKVIELAPPVSYRWKADPSGPRDEGLIAQELEKVFPSVVSESSDGMKRVAYSRLGVYALGAIQEQHAIVESQAGEITTLRKELSDQAARLAKLEALLSRSAAIPPSAN